MPIDPREQAAIDLKIARADALFNYVSVEQALAQLLGTLLAIPDDQAGIIFFNIIASRSRDKIMEDLLEKKFGTQYDTYWYGRPGSQGVEKLPGLFALIQKMSTIRNFIVHWAIAFEPFPSPKEYLIPPNFWNFHKDQRSLHIEEMQDFTQKARFVAGSIRMFTVFAGGLARPTGPSPWPDIFQQPCVYPPVKGHPLAPK